MMLTLMMLLAAGAAVPQLIDPSDPSELKRWTAIHDTVMGGRSQGGLSQEDGMLVFSGRLSLANNGGFASVRTLPRPLPLADHQGQVQGRRRARRQVAAVVRRHQEAVVVRAVGTAVGVDAVVGHQLVAFLVVGRIAVRIDIFDNLTESQYELLAYLCEPLTPRKIVGALFGVIGVAAIMGWAILKLSLTI